MKVVTLVVLVCFVGVDSNIYNFFSMLSDGLSGQFQNAWEAIKEFIKRPPKVKRVHQKTEITTHLRGLHEIDQELEPYPDRHKITTTTSEIPKKPYAVSPDMMYYFQRPRHKQVLLPVIMIPNWKTRDDWLDIQKPQLDHLFRGGRPFMGFKDREGGDVTTDKQLYEEDNRAEDEDIGVMMFV